MLSTPPRRPASRGTFYAQIDELLGEEHGILIYPDPGPQHRR
jgi:hypothetical protein